MRIIYRLFVVQSEQEGPWRIANDDTGLAHTQTEHLFSSNLDSFSTHFSIKIVEIEMQCSLLNTAAFRKHQQCIC